jgi:HD superfamily phosphodiesterase
MECLLDQIVRGTAACSGVWGVDHARRLLALVDRIAGGQAYDTELMRLAAYIHDWGAYAPHAVEGTDHAERSAAVVREATLPALDPRTRERLACVVGRHHTAQAGDTVEAVLLADADAIDMVGAVGVARAFSSNPKDLASGLATLRRRLGTVRTRLILEESSRIAAPRVALVERFRDLGTAHTRPTRP